MRKISLFIFALVCLLVSGSAFALYPIGGGVYCNTSTVTVDGVSYTSFYGCFASGGGGGGGGVGSFPSGGGGSGTTPNNPQSIVDTPNNADSPPATRCSGVYARHDHANRDWRTAVARVISLRATPNGRKVRIKYDDGSSELYFLSGAMMTEPFPGGPIPGTLVGGNSCGGGGRNGPIPPGGQIP